VMSVGSSAVQTARSDGFFYDAIYLVYRAVSLPRVYSRSGCGGTCEEIESALIA
jgi:hypothetical protein